MMPVGTSCGTLGGGLSSSALETSGIIGGQNANRNEYPWQVSLTSRSGNGRPFCGGILITYQHVLTAAHCTDRESPGSFRVEVGTLNWASDPNNYKQVQYVSNHPNYAGVDYDFSIVTLSQPLTPGPSVQP